MASTCTSIINLMYPEGSLGSASNPEPFLSDQDFEELRTKCVSRKRKFVDTKFSPNFNSLGFLPGMTMEEAKRVKWFRPKEILEMLNIKEEPQFSIDGESRFDFAQGYIGNSWFLAAAASLTLNKKIKDQVVPKQSFDDYAGIFHFRFWRYGKWVDVVIDDLLPVYNNGFLSVHSTPVTEFWAPLMEKAYAKVCGSYGDMQGGLTTEACRDMSGHLSLDFDLQAEFNENHLDQLWKALLDGSACNSMMCCGTPYSNAAKNGVITNGLVSSQAYSLTKVDKVYHRGSQVKLVRLMNPWGQQEWNGKWSDNSALWDQVSAEDRAKCTKDNNGEFWMELEDFFKEFCMLSICCENPNFMDGDLSAQWQLTTHEGVWDTAGGNISYATYHTNPQYRIQVSVKNEEEECDMNCFVSLMQKSGAWYRNNIIYDVIAADVFKIPPGTKPGRLDQKFFTYHRTMGEMKHSERRETVSWYSLTPGEYVIVPSTLLQNTSSQFVLSIYAKADVKIDSFEGEDDGEDEEEDVKVASETPANETRDAKAIFEQYANSRNELHGTLLQKLLNDQFSRGNSSFVILARVANSFSLSTCMDFIVYMNAKSGDLISMMNLEEFTALWEKLLKYEKIYLEADDNHNGVLEQAELNQAMKTAGLHFSESYAKKAMFRFTNGGSAINLQNFLALMIQTDHLTNFFKSRASGGTVKLTAEEFFDGFL